MTIADILIVLIALGIVAFGIIYNIRKKMNDKKSGTSGCSGCSGCSVRNNCDKKNM